MEATWKEFIHGTFLDIHKAYDDLDEDICLEILVGYGVGPRALRLLHRYCDHLVIVERMGGFKGDPVKWQSGVTQGEPLYPTFFNVLVNAVLRRCLLEVSGE